MNSGRYLKIYTDFRECLTTLGDAEKGRLFDAMLLYAERGEELDLSGNERHIWPLAKMNIDRQKAKDHSGKNHWNWKGGITPENQRDRNSKEAREWRKNVFSRDDYTCQICHKKGGKINAHHIIPWSENKSLRYELSNGVTLCEKCHKSVHRRNR